MSTPLARGKKPAADPITVSQLTTRIERVLKEGIVETLHVRGQISNFKPYQSSGHFYFTLKDAVSCIDCVMWNSDAVRLEFIPEDGMELVAGGKVGVYPQRGRYQLYVTSLKPIGQGALEIAFQQLRAKLEAEGLFAHERKKPIPMFPTNVVLVTSPQAAGYHDILKVLRRYPCLRLMLYPVSVQGDGAAAQIAAALAHLNRRNRDVRADVIILARGGGSLEDLWAFNEEVVARAMAASSIPIITGIGHEVDVCIADLVADHHAHTPTEAAQTLVSHWREAPARLEQAKERMSRAFRATLQDARHRLRAIERHEAFRRPLDQVHSYRQFLDDRQRALTMALADRVGKNRQHVQELSARLDSRLPRSLRSLQERLNLLQQELRFHTLQKIRTASDEVTRVSTLFAQCHPRYRLKLRAQRLDAIVDRLRRAMRTGLDRSTVRVDALSRELSALSPEGVLRRGFTLTTRKKDGRLLRSAADVKAGDRILTRFGDGEIESVAEDTRQLPLFKDL